MSSDPLRWALAVLTVLAWLIGTGWIVWRAMRGTVAVPAVLGETRIVVASQTGFADTLAEMTRQAFADAGRPARVTALGDIGAGDLTGSEPVLFIVSTTGEGDAPDSASGFVRRVLGQGADLSGLRYGLLALGDRTYRDYCGFGRALDGWLRAQGAQALFDRVEVDNGDAAAIRHWQAEISRLTGSVAAPDWAPPAYEDWRLVERRVLNPGSPGEPAVHLTLEPFGTLPEWVAGDIVEIGVPTPDGGLAHREYSVASLPSDGRVELLVRLMRRPDGTPGLASGWLTEGLPLGAAAQMRLRTNRAFHGPSPETPLILIGNGTGIAGLRAHLKARAAANATGGTWLMFGERTAAHDAFFDEDLTDWAKSGVLTRLDRCFSRDPGDGRYVQALIDQNAEAVRDWIDRGATILVCGSLEGMAGGVQNALETVLGAERVRDLTETGRYRRDIY